jgi:transcriptional regulator with XRE-family HTH domain
MQRNIVGPRVRQARLAHLPKLRQDDLAACLRLQGVELDRPAICKIECQRRAVSDIELAALAVALGVSSSWLLGETENPLRTG